MRNLAHFGERVRWAPGLDPYGPQLLADPQTSGGLLLAVAPERVDRLCSELAARGCLAQGVVGQLVEGIGIDVVARR